MSIKTYSSYPHSMLYYAINHYRLLMQCHLQLRQTIPLCPPDHVVDYRVRDIPRIKPKPVVDENLFLAKTFSETSSNFSIISEDGTQFRLSGCSVR